MSDLDLAIYGHPFSSYTWKVQIALEASGLAFELRMLDADHPEHAAFIAAHAAPLGTFPVLTHGATTIFESTAIIEYLNTIAPAAVLLIPADPLEAVRARMLDRVFDNYVMNTMQAVVIEHLRDPDRRDEARCAHARGRLRRTYAWIDAWLADYARAPGTITLIECAAAPSLFYADWIERIDDAVPRLAGWRAELLALPAVARRVEAARPYRALFPLPAPDRD